MLFIALYRGFLNGTNALLFGSFLGITESQVTLLAAVAVAALAVLAAIGRPLLFTSIDGDVARAHGVPTRALSTAFLILLGITAAEVSQITGALLVFALLVLPAATAQLITPRPLLSLVLSVCIALLTVWIALFIAYYSPYPVGFWLTTLGFGSYALTYPGAAIRDRRGGPSARAVAVTP
jgi:zinc/manganese transport system permease protein